MAQAPAQRRDPPLPFLAAEGFEGALADGHAASLWGERGASRPEAFPRLAARADSKGQQICHGLGRDVSSSGPDRLTGSGWRGDFFLGSGRYSKNLQGMGLLRSDQPPALIFHGVDDVF